MPFEWFLIPAVVFFLIGFFATLRRAKARGQIDGKK